MRIRNFKRAFERYLTKIGPIPEDTELFVMIQENEDPVVKDCLEEMNIKYGIYPSTFFTDSNIKFTFIDKDKGTFGYLKDVAPGAEIHA